MAPVADQGRAAVGQAGQDLLFFADPADHVLRWHHATDHQDIGRTVQFIR